MEDCCTHGIERNLRFNTRGFLHISNTEYICVTGTGWQVLWDGKSGSDVMG